MSALPGLGTTSVRGRRWQKARSPGRARRKPLKPLRAGMPGDSGVLVVTRVRSTTIIAHETAGALGIRRSPRPLWAAELNNASGASRREGERTSGFFVIATRWLAMTIYK